MRARTVNLKHYLTAAVAAVLLGGPLWAETVPDDLWDRLQTANDIDAPRVAAEIEAVWSRSGSAAMDLLLRRGREAIEEGDFALAIEHLTALTDHAPGFAEGYHARAEAYFRADLYGPALDDLEMALALNPQHYDAMFGLGVMLQEFGKPRRAARLFRKVLALYPAHKNAQAALDRMKRDGIGREL